MKRNVVKSLILMMAMMPMCVFAQKTKLKKCSMTVYYSNLDFYHNGVEYDVPVYYDDDDNEVKHGAFNVVDNFSKNGAVLTYKASGNYINRKLHGSVTLEKNEKVPSRKLSIQIKGTVNYENGVPNGKWTFSEIATLGSKKGTKSCTMVFKNGYLVSYNNNDNYNFTLNENLNLTGKIDGIEYEKGINMTYFVRKTGSDGELEENQKMLLKDFLSGKTTKEDLMNEGYIFELERAPIISSDLTGYFGELQIGEFSEDPYERIMPQFAGDYVELTLERISYPQKLKRVNIISTDAIMKELEEAVKSDNFGFDPYRLYSRDNFLIELSENKISYYRNHHECYFTDETKAKITEYLKDLYEKKIKSYLQRQFEYSKNCGADILTAFCPVINYEILDIESSENGFIAKCKLNKFISETEGYETYKTEAYFDEDGKIQSGSFNKEQSVRVENDWDKIRNLRPQIKTNTIKLKGEKDKFLSDVVSAYLKYHKSYNFEVGDNTRDCISRLESFVKVQNQCFEFIELRKKINANDVSISRNKTTHKNIVELYDTYFKAVDLTWNSDEKVKDKLAEVIATQDRLIQILSSEYALLLDVTIVEEKIVDLQSMFDCFATIDLRKQRNENNGAIMQQAGQCKNIAKLYDTYFKETNLSWTSVTGAKDVLVEIIAGQEQLKSVLSTEKASLLETAIVEEKISDFKSVLQCIEVLDLRKQRNENNAAIMAQAKQCKNIVKIYAAYFKKLDFTWVSADASKVKFEEVIANQNIIRKALESSNAAELDTAVKKEKIKDIQTLVNRLK